MEFNPSQEMIHVLLYTCLNMPCAVVNYTESVVQKAPHPGSACVPDCSLLGWQSSVCAGTLQSYEKELLELEVRSQLPVTEGCNNSSSL